jgi:hypothetical protein
MNGITTQRAKEFGLNPQAEGESDMAFRNRVSGRLRDMGHLIEAHEAYSDRLYDDPEGDAMTGVIGAIAQAMQGRDYGKRGSDQIGVDIAAGLHTQHAERSNPSANALMLMMAMLTGK